MSATEIPITDPIIELIASIAIEAARKKLSCSPETQQNVSTKRSQADNPSLPLQRRNEAIGLQQRKSA